jgi:predicted RecB family nuclease
MLLYYSTRWSRAIYRSKSKKYYVKAVYLQRSMKITASHLYSYNTCPHRVWRDAHDNQKLKDEPNEFVQLLWEKGTQYEKDVLAKMEGDQPVLDLSIVPKEDRAQATLDAMSRKEPLIYHGRLEVGELLGEPDLLELQSDGEYMPVDIKSGMGFEGGDDFKEGKPKKHYALQLSLYTDALRQLGFATHYCGKIFDSSGSIVVYELDKPKSKTAKVTWWEEYEEALMITRNILLKKIQTKPALGATCKMCVWYGNCKKTCIEKDYLSLIPGLGRANQENLEALVETVHELAAINPEDHIDAKDNVDLPGIRRNSLEKFHRRAVLLSSGSTEMEVKEPYTLPERDIELYFDIETDPTQSIVYLHGVVERRNGDSTGAKFHSFLANGVNNTEERSAWVSFWEYIRGLDGEFAVYYYSSYEKTQFKKLRGKYPDVVSKDELEHFFENEDSIDLLQIVQRHTEWPTYNHSVKTLAQHLGFEWRDKNPSGAASIQWFNEWCKDQSSEKMQRILDYNEDDCIAMMVLKDELVKHC